MWKKYLSKLPRKPSKSDFSADPTSPVSEGAGETASSTISNGISNRSTSTLKRMSAAVFPSSVVAGIEPLLSFKDVPAQERQNLFISKLSLCCVVFDFTDPSKNAAEKELKRQTLLELVKHVSSGSNRFCEPVVAAGCHMFTVNLFRVFPPTRRPSPSGGENDEDEPTFEPAWSHLQVIYELLLKFIASSSLDAKIAKRYFDHSFISKLLQLFDSEDPRERECVKTVLHRIYGKFMVHRPFIRKAVSNIFYTFVYEAEKHRGIGELLEVLGSVISGFALPLKEEHKMFLWRTLIPLHKAKSLGSYFQQLTFCISQFLDKEPKLASMVVMGLLRYWPVTSSQKEVMFLTELEEILEVIDPIEFQRIIVPVFQRISHCLTSSHFQVAERALYLWNNDQVVDLISQNRQVIMPIMFPALERNTRNHWNSNVLALSSNIKKMLAEMDQDLFLICQEKFKEEAAQLAASEEKRRSAWQQLEAVAASQPVSEKTAVLVTPLFQLV